MRITLDNLMLGDTQEAPISGYTCSVSRAVQTSQRPRAVAVVQYARLNRETTITFETTRLHTSISVAFRFLHDHELDIPAQGLLKITTDDPRWERYLESCCAELVTNKAIGCTTFHSYRLTGGQIAKRRTS